MAAVEFRHLRKPFGAVIHCADVFIREGTIMAGSSGHGDARLHHKQI